MRVALAMILLLSGCSELDPNFAVSQWFDGVETTQPISMALHTDSADAGPDLWQRSMGQSREGEFAWHFGNGMSYPELANASLDSPDFEAGRRNFLRFSVWTDVPTLSDSTATDGLAVEGRIDDDDWILLEPDGGYTHTVDQIVVASPLPLRSGVFAGTDREWRDTWVELPGAEQEQMVTFRFRFGADIDPDNNMGEGVYVDNVEFLIVEW